MDNVVQMEVFFYLKQQIFYSKSDDGIKLIQNIVFEYVESNLENLIEDAQRTKVPIKETLIKVNYFDIMQKYIYQLLNGLKNIHKYSIAHRDLKPENVLLSDKG